MCRLYDELKQNTEIALQAASAGSQVSSVASESLHKQILLLNKVASSLQYWNANFTSPKIIVDSCYPLQERDSYIELLKQTNTELEHVKQSEHVRFCTFFI